MEPMDDKMKSIDFGDEPLDLWLAKMYLPPEDEEGDVQPLSSYLMSVVFSALVIVIVLLGQIMRN